MTVTKRYKLLQQLTERQYLAIDAILAGSTHAKAAEVAGVHRVTVSTWASTHAEFQAELNRRRSELLSERADRIRSLDALALAVVAERIEQGDPDASMRWLRLRRMGTVAVQDIGPTDAVGVVEIEVMRRMRDYETTKFEIITSDDLYLQSLDEVREEVWREFEVELDK